VGVKEYKVSGEDVAIISRNGKQYHMAYKTDWSLPRWSAYKERMDWLGNIGLYGKDYYYCDGDLWFRKERDLMLYLLRWE
jgi:hypothetical protein